MAFSLSKGVSNLNSAMFPQPNKLNNERLGVFGGESVGFAKGVGELYAKQFYTSSFKPSPTTVASGMAKPLVQAMANKYALFNFQGFNGNILTANQDNYIDNANNSLMGGKPAETVSITKIIEHFQTNYKHIKYEPSNFLYSKYYKKIPVNHLITLRRFALPVVDNIYSYKVSGKDGETALGVPPAGVTAITYMGETAGNTLEELLKMSYGLKWKDLDAKFEEINRGGQDDYTQQPWYQKSGIIGRSTGQLLAGDTAGEVYAKKNGAGSETADKLGTTYANFVLGPINVVDKTTIRDRGITFQNDLKLQFEYELRSLNYINPKIAMIDIMSNMLTMTTNNAAFFGGGHRYYGNAGAVGSVFGDPNMLAGGNFGGYIASVASDIQNGFSGLFGGSDGNFDINTVKEGLKTVGKNMLGNMMGDFLGSMIGGKTGTQATRSLISGEPTGEWHVTVGNPLNPIAMMGNMYCDNSVMTMGQGLGYDDFPMEVKFEIDLKHGKPRDKGDIENMFNAGNGRIYAAIQSQDDILNLEGADIEVYGGIQAGTSSTSSSSNQAGAGNGAPPASANNDLTNVSTSSTLYEQQNMTADLYANMVLSVNDGVAPGGIADPA